MPGSKDPLVEGLAKMASFMLGEDTLEEILSRVVELAKSTMTPVDTASLTLLRDGRYVTSAPTDTTALALDEAQFLENTGPCIDAASGGEAIHVPLLSQEERWPAFRSVASKEGIVAVLSLPLRPFGHGVPGSLNLYSRKPDPFGPERPAADLFATHAAVLLANARSYKDAELLTADLRRALESREVIGQAKGVLMEREGIDSEEAFNLLAQISQRTNWKLRDVAASLVASSRRGTKERDRDENASAGA